MFSYQQPTNILSQQKKESNIQEDNHLFHGLLLNEQAGPDNKMSNLEEENLDESSSDMEDLLSHMLIGYEELVNLDVKDTSIQKTNQELEKRSEFFADYPLIKEADNDETQLDTSESLSNVHNELNVSKNPILQQIFSLNQRFENLISQISNGQEAKQLAPELVVLLEQYTKLQSKYNKQKDNLDTLEKVKNETSKENGLWRELFNVFNKSGQLIMKHQYNTDEKVTSTDVVKWVQSALTDNISTEKAIDNPSISSTSMPLSRVEQYIIYLNTSSQNADQQLMDQFQRVIKESRFSVMPHGQSQISITLRPDNLGEMVVRLTQVNGEMTVKIIVTSEATKEMLQSNVHQLKNMFSPQQVFIEKQELNTQQNQEANEPQQEQSMKEQEQNQQDQSKQDDKPSEDDFETRFHELLMNEKV